MAMVGSINTPCANYGAQNLPFLHHSRNFGINLNPLKIPCPTKQSESGNEFLETFFLIYKFAIKNNHVICEKEVKDQNLNPE